MKKVENICSCDGENKITTDHILLCDKHKEIRDQFTQQTGFSYAYFLQEMEAHQVKKSSETRDIIKKMKKLQTIIVNKLFMQDAC